MSVLHTASHQQSATDSKDTQEPLSPIESAKAAGLRYVSDAKAGIHRKRVGKHFSYIGFDGKPIHDQKVLHHIRSLAIPPAWTQVWICPNPRGHLQATGRDTKGRKQYRYHPEWRKVRDETKYDRMIAFGHALPHIREHVAHDMALPGLPREKVLATLVRLLDETSIRIGNEEYMRDNESFGLTTMRENHVDVEGAIIHFQFRGKGGKEFKLDIKDRRLARIVKKCQDLPGQELFHYLDDEKEAHIVSSEDVNEYLKQMTGQEFTAKDFRTWAGTIIAACALLDCGECETKTEAKKNVAQAIESAAQHLGNTPAICRKSYVHPEIIDAYLAGTLHHAQPQQNEKSGEQSSYALQPEEQSVLALLEQER
ncbi:DNA topoisomerase [Reticulibacter mediterranei]|uniref:DNA topoisomerase n=1 Tax=Reticulibacter mediterranei TaxID=2778369 RepID=A0A8J3IKK0_9CHLR|nr:DNA topoisomerase IB [Reticulibacter mediterranei]GHO91266.1 DNA topoisomerase [Reticulibacter mediterranei]